MDRKIGQEESDDVRRPKPEDVRRKKPEEVSQPESRKVINTYISPCCRGRGLEYLDINEYEDAQKAEKMILCPMCDFNGYQELTFSLVSHVKVQLINGLSIIHSIGSERILKQRSITRPWGESYLGNDYETTKFVRENTTIPIVEIMEYWVSDDTQWWLMSKVPGERLDLVWDGFNPEQQKTLILEIVDYIAQARKFTRPTPQTADGAPIRDNLLGSMNRVQMLTTDKEEWFARITPYLTNESDKQKRFLKENYPLKPGDKFVLTHGDLNASNILVQDGHVTGIIDWEHSGFYPEWWEWVYCLKLANGGYGRLLLAELGKRFGAYRKQYHFSSEYDKPKSRERITSNSKIRKSRK
jgi:hypothetical protein